MENSKLNNKEAMNRMFISDTLKISPDEWENACQSDDKKEQEKALMSIAIKCANRAYLDYNRTLEFTDDEKNKDHSDFRKGLYELTITQISNLIRKDEKETAAFDFDGWHNEACEAIMKAVDKKHVLKDSFSYGQAQKQLNMTLKYMWLLGLWPVLNSESITQKLHAVVDNYIIKAAWEISEIYLPVQTGKKRSGTKYFSDKLEFVWSRWDATIYTAFQQSLKDYVASDNTYSCVFEWEQNAWNSIATEGKNLYSGLIEYLMTRKIFL